MTPQRPDPGQRDGDDERLLALGRAVLETEITALQDLRERLDGRFVQACRYLLACRGRIVVLGMGKSGHIGGKIAATLASTGSPAFFVHPGEASHGDLGMIVAGDVALALSNSGQTEEILTILPIIKRLGVPLIALTGNLDSPLAREADCVLDVRVAREACPLGLAPTASTTATLAMGDALAVALLEARGFTAEDFARAHPGGRLGRRLLLHVGDLMHREPGLPKVMPATLLAQALLEVSRRGLGLAVIVDSDDRILGVFTDGDLRRCIDRGVDIRITPIGEVMTSPCRSVTADLLAVEALALMENHKINALPVRDERGRLIGAFNMHDLLRAGVA